jgi:L-asparaginase
MAVALHPGACGVMAVCAGAIHGADHLQKIHPYRLDAFDSGDAGPLGYVEEGVVRLASGWRRAALASYGESSANAVTARSLPNLPWPRVEIVISHAGAGGTLVDSICQAEEAVRPLRGIVVAGTGNGSIHQSLEAALQRARAQGIRVVRSTKCAYGAVVQSNTPQADAIAATPLSPVKARVQLVLDLMSGL